jgi:hypothetical protein
MVRCRPRTFPQSADRVEQPRAIADQSDPEVLEILSGQARQQVSADPAPILCSPLAMSNSLAPGAVRRGIYRKLPVRTCARGTQPRTALSVASRGSPMAHGMGKE